MKILEITPYIPYPPDSGSSILVYNAARELARRGHSLTLACLRVAGKPLPTLNALEDFCDFRPVMLSGVAAHKAAAHSLVSGKPYTIAKRWSPEAARRFLEIGQETRPDVILADHLHTLQYAVPLGSALGAPVAYRAHNVETTIWERFAAVDCKPWLRPAALAEKERVRRYEAKRCAQADLCLMVTPEDECALRAFQPYAKTGVIPSGVDTERYQPVASPAEEPNTVLTIGSMDWHPNVDAALWFAEEVLPRIWRQAPDTRFVVVGKEPPRALQQIAGERIVVTGYVTDDREYLARAAVVVVPMRQGGGIKIKTLTAMAMGKGIVASPRGIEGIPFTSGRDGFVAEDPDAFAARVLEFLQAPALRKEMGDAARELILRQFDWPQVGRALEIALHSLIADAVTEGAFDVSLSR